MNEDQLKGVIDSLQKQLDTLRNQLAGRAKNKKLNMWKPAYMQSYWLISVDGDVYSADFVRAPYSDRRASIGNTFITEELAKHYATRRAALQRLEMLALADNALVPYGFQCESKNICNYYIGWHKELGVCVMDFTTINPGGVVYFPTKEAGIRVLDAMTDEDLITLFGTAKRFNRVSNDT